MLARKRRGSAGPVLYGLLVWCRRRRRRRGRRGPAGRGRRLAHIAKVIVCASSKPTCSTAPAGRSPSQRLVGRFAPTKWASRHSQPQCSPSVCLFVCHHVQASQQGPCVRPFAPDNRGIRAASSALASGSRPTRPTGRRLASSDSRATPALAPGSWAGPATPTATPVDVDKKTRHRLCAHTAMCVGLYNQTDANNEIKVIIRFLLISLPDSGRQHCLKLPSSGA